MITNINSRMILSGATIIAAAALIVGATFAFFTDTETSTGNTFTAGKLDLKVDSTAHYAGMVCDDPLTPGTFVWKAEIGGDTDPALPNDASVTRPELLGTSCDGTWDATDLGAENKFFNFSDLKPGDSGENTISLHVLNNDAWGQFTVSNVKDLDNTCTEPEEDSTADSCVTASPESGDTDGELAENLTFDAWLDMGSAPGFQCGDPNLNDAPCSDTTEGDNIHQEYEGPLFWNNQTISGASAGPFNISDVLAAAYTAAGCTDVDGNTNYGNCHGLAQDGRMVGSANYYFGLAWNLPDTAGNEVQSDSLTADMRFDVVQHRNNPGPNPTGFPTP